MSTCLRCQSMDVENARLRDQIKVLQARVKTLKVMLVRAGHKYDALEDHHE